MSLSPKAQLALVLAACTPGRQVHRFYDTELICQRSFERGVTTASALSSVDIDQDGRLTAADLRLGEAAAVHRVEGQHVHALLPREPGAAVAADWHATLVPTGETAHSHRFTMRLNCHPTTALSLDFELPPTIGSAPTEVAIQQFQVIADVLQVRSASSEARVSGALQVFVADGRVSGWLIGNASAPLETWDIPRVNYDVPDVTGQVFELYALAFRDLEVAP